MTDWKIFKGNNTQDTNWTLPEPPSWRDFNNSESDPKKRRAETFQARSEEIDLVNAALYLRRPLLVTGKPGTGKTSLAYAVAYELGLGEVLHWPITTRTTLKDGLYNYDAIGRLQDAKDKDKDKDNLAEIGKYINLSSLGTALLPSDKPRVLLIDEIDKSDIDLPNDLLHIFEEGEFEIPELRRIADKLDRVEVQTAYKDQKATIEKGRIRCTSFPFVILTSNGERDFPPPFLRRCIRLNIQEPDKTELERIVKAHLQLDDELSEKADNLIEQFLKKRQNGELATDQLLNAVYLVTRENSPTGTTKDDLIEKILKYLDSSEDS
ncbi:MoxR family ATPase [Dolichospermum sp. UHCC 0684]|jgi:MoxR-like ATPase|uniref:AAA family ATPase n=1 Tax=unclassified Dolichospermum TaxID=2622029 RepID=UPI001448A014|nr:MULTISPECIES: MoxR family ATPase [unclassified Dolichospermum]MEA5530471.1 MoxR family ATPase [Dolichospermum sp. UHCC 0684]MTJ35942.1 MoxR family ATPase [Dolichospermum sp. UHCC 0260]MTJ48871.1 MoxR family ATPase [Dolichospermum sp. UHCC 0259]